MKSGNSNTNNLDMEVIYAYTSVFLFKSVPPFGSGIIVCTPKRPVYTGLNATFSFMASGTRVRWGSL